MNGTDIIVQALTATRNRTVTRRDGTTKVVSGLHVVYDGLNDRLRQLGLDPLATVDAAVASGKVVKRGAKGGPILYLAADAPKSGRDGGASEALDKVFAAAAVKPNANAKPTTLGSANGPVRIATPASK